MEFDLDKFSGTDFNAREEDVAVPDLADFFKGKATKGEDGKDQPPVWRVRGLSGSELARVNEAQTRNRDRNAIAQGLLSGKDEKVTEAVRALVGGGDDVPDDIAKRLEMLVIASVKPEISHPVAVKLSETFPIEFYQLTSKITQLTGLGAEPGKPKRSSGRKTSEQPSNSAT